MLRNEAYNKGISIHTQQNPGCNITASVPVLPYASRLPVTSTAGRSLVGIGYMRYLALMPFPARNFHSSCAIIVTDTSYHDLQDTHDCSCSCQVYSGVLPTTGVLRYN